MNRKVAATSRTTWIKSIGSQIPVVLNLFLAGILALAAWNTDRTTTKQVTLINDATRVMEDLEKSYREDAMIADRNDFGRALDDAEKLCRDCPYCSPSYLIEIPLDKAASFRIESGDNYNGRRV